MTKYKVFTNDRGPREFSRFDDIMAVSLKAAQDLARLETAGLQESETTYPLMVVVIPESRMDGAEVGTGMDWNLTAAAVKEFRINAGS